MTGSCFGSINVREITATDTRQTTQLQEGGIFKNYTVIVSFRDKMKLTLRSQR